MKNPQSRLRIYSIQFGYGLVYYNDSVVNSTLDSYVSPISADIPQIDFSVELKNYDKYFNVDNPSSAINFFDTGMEMDISYGYQLPNSNEIEWILGNKLLCAEWESDDYTATIRCHDVFRNMDGEYYKGYVYRYDRDGKSYYELAMEVLADAGITEYYLDPILDEHTTYVPLPRVPHKEALQIIANACRCVMWQTRDGVLQIKSFADTDENVTDFTMTRNDMTSSPRVIKQELVKEIVVPYYSYRVGKTEESLIRENISVKAGDTITFFLNEPACDFRATYNESSSGVTIVESGNYYVKVRFDVSGSNPVEIFGYSYEVIERQVTKSLNAKGKTIKWENPLISEKYMAAELADWLGEYYISGVEYEYSTRGNPELDVNDIIYQENDFRDNMQVNLYRYTLNFKQSFSGDVTVRRIGG
jgi:hypothetical protein